MSSPLVFLKQTQIRARARLLLFWFASESKHFQFRIVFYCEEMWVRYHLLSQWIIFTPNMFFTRVVSFAFPEFPVNMASRKRPHDSTKPETPTNGLNSSLEDINIANGSNSSSNDAHHNNGDSSTMADQYTIKYTASNKPVSWCENNSNGLRRNLIRPELFNE